MHRRLALQVNPVNRVASSSTIGSDLIPKSLSHTTAPKHVVRPPRGSPFQEKESTASKSHLLARLRDWLIYEETSGRLHWQLASITTSKHWIDLCRRSLLSFIDTKILDFPCVFQRSMRGIPHFLLFDSIVSVDCLFYLSTCERETHHADLLQRGHGYEYTSTHQNPVDTSTPNFRAEFLWTNGVLKICSYEEK